MRTEQEILERLEQPALNDPFGFERNNLVDHLPFSSARTFLKDGVTEEEWEKGGRKPLERDAVEAEVADYMQFALDKAENHRGLSASRSLSHFKAWLWLLGDDDLYAFADDEDNYTNYGVPVLRAVGEKYGIPLPTSEAWFDNMSQGELCGGAECTDGGCGRA